MDNSLKIGKYIRLFLLDSESFGLLVSNDNVYPLVAPANTEGNYVVYQRTGIKPEYTKDSMFKLENHIYFEVNAISKNYSESLDIACEIRKRLELRKYKDDDIHITSIKLDSATEEFANDEYILKLIFTISVD